MRLHAVKIPDNTVKELVFDRLNQSYQDLNPTLAEVDQGPLLIQLSSPKQVIHLRGHRLSLRPLGNGLHQFHLIAEFEGSGDLSAIIDLMGLDSQFTDTFLIPLQKKKMTGKVKIEHSETGYRITPVSLPKQTQVIIRTGLGGKLVNGCRSLSWLPDAVLDCKNLKRSLTRLTVPLPQGRSYFVAMADLTPQEQDLLAAYLK